jgi:hypothetical protein
MGGQTKGFSLGATYDSEKFSVEKAESEKNREAG